MANVIIAWEYHKEDFQISYLKHLQSQFIAWGHNAYLVGANYAALLDASYPFLFAPKTSHLTLHKSQGITRIGGFSDRLAVLGFDDIHTLTFLVHAWEHLFSLLKPDVIIADCAPTANLAAWNEIPVLQLSDGFGLPPANLPDFPRLRPDAPPLAATHSMLSNVNEVQAKRGKAQFKFLPQLMTGEGNFIYHLQEFDPYLMFRAKNQKLIHGPFFDLPHKSHEKKPQQYFAYLDTNYPDIEEIIIALNDTEGQGFFYVPHVPHALANYLTVAGQVMCANLAEIEKNISQCDYVIHHGNVHIAQTALTQGIPQFMLPQHFESDWTSHMLMERGIGVSIYPAINTIEHIKAHIVQGRDKTTMREWAALRAQQIAERHCEPIEEAVLRGALTHIA